MELCYRVPTENWEVFQTLEGKLLDPSLMKGKIIGNFPYANEYIADLPENTEYFVKNWEYGGGTTNTGKATVVCGINGEKLKPVRIYTTGHLSNNIHAEFESRRGCQITSLKSGRITVVYYYIKKTSDLIELKTEKIWEGPVDSIPNKFNYLVKAIRVCHAKANIFHCREAIYIKE